MLDVDSSEKAGMKAHTAIVVELLKESPEWRDFFRSCCETSALRLRAQVWQFADELYERGHHLDLEDLEDTLFNLAQHHFPNTPAADFSEWSVLVYKDTLTRLQEHYTDLSEEEKEAVDLIGMEDANEQMEATSSAKNRAAFREAVREYERATLKAFEMVRGVAGEASSGKEAA